jgi:cytochrome P450
MKVAPPAHPPIFAGDLFHDDALRSPFGLYRAIRDLAPVVRLEDHDFYAIGRFADVQSALRAADILVSGQGTGLNAVVNAPNENRPTVESDGERHRRLRGVLNKTLLPAHLKQYRSLMSEMIASRVDMLIDGHSFAGSRQLAGHLPIEIVSHLVGLPDVDRANMLRWAAAAFNTIAPIPETGPVAKQVAADFEALQQVREYLRMIDPAQLKPDSWTDRLFRQVADGDLSESDARAAISGLVLPSLDTTISAASWLLYNLARFPDEWDKLRSDPSLIRSAVLEGMRFSSVARWFSRVAVRDYDVDGYLVPAGSRIMVMYQCANRDERRFADPDRFDVTRNAADQLGWGTGPHMCAGMHLARMEMETLLEALVERVARIEVYDAVIGINRGLHTIERLPMRLVSGH